jgi:hypothetical protein
MNTKCLGSIVYVNFVQGRGQDILSLSLSEDGWCPGFIAWDRTPKKTLPLLPRNRPCRKQQLRPLSLACPFSRQCVLPLLIPQAYSVHVTIYFCLCGYEISCCFEVKDNLLNLECVAARF